MADLASVYGHMAAGQQSVMRYAPYQQAPPTLTHTATPVHVPEAASPKKQPSSPQCNTREIVIMLAVGILAILLIDSLSRKQ
jgi:hypothetical protein